MAVLLDVKVYRARRVYKVLQAMQAQAGLLEQLVVLAHLGGKDN